MRRTWQLTPVFLPGEPHRQRSLAGYSPWGSKELDTAEQLSTVQINITATNLIKLSLKGQARVYIKEEKSLIPLLHLSFSESPRIRSQALIQIFIICQSKKSISFFPVGKLLSKT